MKQLSRIVIAILIVFAIGGQNTSGQTAAKKALKSPDNQLELSFEVVDGIPTYALFHKGNPVILPSRMGFTLEWRDDLAHAFVLKDT